MATRDQYLITGVTLEDVKRVLNIQLSRMADRLDKIEGIRGGSSIESDLDMNENNLNNVAGLAVSGNTTIGGDLAITGDSTLAGDLLFTGGGLAYGEISVEDNSTETTITTQNVAVQVEIFDTNGKSNNTVPDHSNDHITISSAGIYFVAVSATINSIAGAASRAEITVQKNNGSGSVIPHVDRNLAGGGGESGVISISGFAELAVDDTLEVFIENETNTQNYIVEDISLAILQVGGS